MRPELPRNCLGPVGDESCIASLERKGRVGTSGATAVRAQSASRARYARLWLELKVYLARRRPKGTRAHLWKAPTGRSYRRVLCSTARGSDKRRALRGAMEGMEGMKQTNLAAMLSALRSSADGCKQEGNAHFATGAVQAGLFRAPLTRSTRQATWRRPWKPIRARQTCQTRCAVGTEVARRFAL